MDRNVRFSGKVTGYEETLKQILPELHLTWEESAEYTVTLIPERGLQVQVSENSATIHFDSKAQLCRGLSHLRAHMDDMGFSCTEKQHFRTIGTMLVTSGTVTKMDKMKWYLRKLALMGMNFIMLYLEDGYEIPGEPYFGYMRGQFTQQQLKEIDDYAWNLGIEVILNIQTLGHLECVLKWPAYSKIRNSRATLLVGEEETYAFIEKEIKAAMAPLRTKRVHLGMDEAPQIVEGVHRRKHGLQDFPKLFKQHVTRVVEITKKLGYEPIMYSDLYFDHAFGFYYEKDRDFPQEILDSIVPGIQLNYWDYYTSDVKVYDHMFQLHRKLAGEPMFLGGIYDWFGVFPDYVKTLEASLPALESAKNNQIQEVLVTNWGNSTMNLPILLYGLQVYAEYCYTGEYHRNQVCRRLEACCGLSVEPFEAMQDFNHIPGDLVGKEVRSSGSPKRASNLLYEDPVAPLMEADFSHIDLVSHFDGLCQKFTDFAQQYPEYANTFRFAAQFAKVLHKKCQWRLEAPAAVRAGDRERAGKLVAFARELYEEIDALRRAWKTLWYEYNLPYGYEVHELQLGGLLARMRTAAEYMEDFSQGKIDDIPEMTRKKLPFSRFVDGAPEGCVRKQTWHQVASVNTMHRPSFMEEI